MIRPPTGLSSAAEMLRYKQHLGMNRSSIIARGKREAFGSKRPRRVPHSRHSRAGKTFSRNAVIKPCGVVSRSEWYVKPDLKRLLQRMCGEMVGVHRAPFLPRDDDLVFVAFLAAWTSTDLDSKLFL